MTIRVMRHSPHHKKHTKHPKHRPHQPSVVHLPTEHYKQVDYEYGRAEKTNELRKHK